MLPPCLIDICPQVTSIIFYYAENFPFGLLEPHRPVNSKGRHVVSLVLLIPKEKSLP